MSNDKYVAVPWSAHDLERYPCGVAAGAKVRLRKDIAIQDSEGRPTGEVHKAGETWEVLKGLSSEPTVVWLRQPGGMEHTWTDDDLLDWFEVVPGPTT